MWISSIPPHFLPKNIPKYLTKSMICSLYISRYVHFTRALSNFSNSLKICSNTLGCNPLCSSLFPSIVNVFPAPVWPYAKIVELYPFWGKKNHQQSILNSHQIHSCIEFYHLNSSQLVFFLLSQRSTLSQCFHR